MSISSLEAARKFVSEETQFQLGFLPTEQSHPQTRDLEECFARSTACGISCLQRVDRNVLEMAKRVLKQPEFRKLVDCGIAALKSGHQIVFSGCGATGRLAILLESVWRNAAHPGLKPYQNQVKSIMTGGDYALVRAVEFFEDYAAFGARQAQELALGPGDVLIAITEGGETSSVLGSLSWSIEAGAAGFLLFNNPAELLCEHLERSRKMIEDPRVTVLDLSCGPMALAGSTRMQATTSEQLIAGIAEELWAAELCGAASDAEEFLNGFASLLIQLENAAPRLADYLETEYRCYTSGGKITYFALDYLLDIFTDTTERTPTFMLDPFRKCDDTTSPESLALVKSPLYPVNELWQNVLKRPLRCLEWQESDYLAMGAQPSIVNTPPKISETELLKFALGCEQVPSRMSHLQDLAVLAVWDEAEARRGKTAALAGFPRCEVWDFSRHLQLDIPSSGLDLIRHLAVKLTMNTLSTGIMVKLGRVSGNWMSFVAATNKKLIDRAIRLVAELGKISYDSAAEEIFAAMEEYPGRSPVQTVLKKQL